LIRARADALGLAVADELVARLGTYLDLLARWNRRINLTSFNLDAPADAAIDRLIVEPLRAAAFVRAEDRIALDIGSGGGSPAIPLALACPWLQMTLVEVRARKAAFLREAVRALDLASARVEAVAVETLAASSLVNRVDVVTMRAVRADREIWMTVEALLAPGGRALWFGGDPAAIESTTLAPVDRTDIVLVVAHRRNLKDQPTIG
jgi:16S rRNA (guanine527-N7)-methyltransferase